MAYGRILLTLFGQTQRFNRSFEAQRKREGRILLIVSGRTQCFFLFGSLVCPKTRTDPKLGLWYQRWRDFIKLPVGHSPTLIDGFFQLSKKQVQVQLLFWSAAQSACCLWSQRFFGRKFSEFFRLFFSRSFRLLFRLLFRWVKLPLWALLVLFNSLLLSPFPPFPFFCYFRLHHFLHLQQLGTRVDSRYKLNETFWRIDSN